jgi:integrase
MSITRRITSHGDTRYDVRTRIAGRAVTKTFRRRRDADAYAVRLESDRLDGILVDPRLRRTPFTQAAETWLAQGAQKRSTSIARDRSIIAKHLDPEFGDRPIGAITRAEVQSAVDKWTATQAPSTIGRQYSCLRAIFTYAEANDLVTRSPCRGIRRPKVQLVDRPELNVDQLSRLADALGSEQGTFMWCAAVLGFRWSETAGLTVDRIDFTQRRVTVNRQLNRTGELVPPKTSAGNRTLSCPDWLLDMLKVVAPAPESTGKQDQLVFQNGDGGPLSYTNWRTRIWQPGCERGVLPGLRYHDLRSHAATILVGAGVDIKTAQVRLGHASPQVTLGIYARATKDADRRAADLVGELLRPRDRRAMESNSEGEQSPDKPATRDNAVGARGLEPPTSAV